ncbi:MAG TPA: hypothetical protein VFV19_18855 [Candidatus Polarisedimenticolaceae bacterium]|nr:hypothetical protein [Candidatus Polarisedimenticolaceae bacterium]
MSQRTNHQEIVKRALDTKAVDFNQIAKLIGELGPSVSLADDPWDVFCGTMRHFIRFYVIRGGIEGNPVADLAALRGVAGELRS